MKHLFIAAAICCSQFVFSQDQPQGLRLTDQSGVGDDRIDPPGPLPTYIRNGDIYIIPTGPGMGTYIFWDKQVFWTGSAYAITGSISKFDPSIGEKKIYAFRRKMLKVGGHL
jgi:hypothetical protein